MRTVMNRWFVVLGAILIQLCLGAIYAWSAFTDQLTGAGFSRTQTQVIFAAGLLTFAVVMALIAGRLQRRYGPRAVSMAGGIVLGAGYLLAGFSGPSDNPSFWGILIGVGLLGGAGIGLGYVCPIAALVKWFPDKKGLITGLAVAGFGFGALAWIKMTSGFEFGPIDLTPGWEGLYGMGWGVSEVFRLYGVLFMVLIGIGSLLMANPPAGWHPAGWVAPTGVAADGTVNMTEWQMVKTRNFWILFANFTAGGIAGLMVIGIIQLFGIDRLTAGGMEYEQAAVVAGTAMGLFYAILNGFGRIAWGAISDKTGRKNAIVLMNVLQAVMMALLFFVGGNELGLYFAAAVIGFNYGGNFAVFPAATADYFGNKNVGTNYPWVFMAYGLGGIIGPVLGGVMGDAQAWLWAFIPAAIACLVSAALAGGLDARASTAAKPIPAEDTKLAAE